MVLIQYPMILMEIHGKMGLKSIIRTMMEMVWRLVGNITLNSIQWILQIDWLTSMVMVNTTIVSTTGTPIQTTEPVSLDKDRVVAISNEATQGSVHIQLAPVGA